MINFYDDFSSEDEFESNFLRRGHGHHPHGGHNQGQRRPWIDMEAEEHGKFIFKNFKIFSIFQDEIQGAKNLEILLFDKNNKKPLIDT